MKAHWAESVSACAVGYVFGGGEINRAGVSQTSLLPCTAATISIERALTARQNLIMAVCVLQKENMIKTIKMTKRKFAFPKIRSPHNQVLKSHVKILKVITPASVLHHQLMLVLDTCSRYYEMGLAIKGDKKVFRR